MKAGRALALAALALAAVLTARALALTSRQLEVAPAPPVEGFDPEAVAERLAGAIRFASISEHRFGDRHASAFRGLREYLRGAYPRTHAALSREVVAGQSLLYTWPGRDRSAPARLLAAHLDVVPVEAGHEELWAQPPFAGVIADGEVWGRGAIDDKASLVCLLEAVESLLAAGFAPPRDVLLAFGHDEEVGGERGAAAIAARLAERGIALESVLDEGGVVATGMLEAIARPVAVVGVAEKGAVNLLLSVRAAGGHSSTPPRQGAIGVLAAALQALEANPMPARIGDTTRGFLEALGAELSFGPRLALANLWLSAPLLERVFASTPPLDAMIRTSTAVTMFHGGVKANVLPKRAEAVVNFRILPGDRVEDVIAHVRRTIDDERVEIETTGPSTPREPSAVSPHDAPAFLALQRSIHATFPDAIVVPYLVVGGTDARHYAGLTANVHRFNPFLLGSDTLRLAHGTDERISLANLERGVRFYRHLLERAE